MRTTAFIRTVETQETQMRTVSIILTTWIFNISWLSTRMNYFDVKGLSVGSMNNCDVGTRKFIGSHHGITSPVSPK